MAKQFSTRSGSVRRLLQEAKEIANDPSITEFHAAPLEDELFEWHFTIKVPDAEFAGGIYHGRILLPAEYPLKPPDVILLTPNGRFELNRKICLTITSFHAEAWQPSWGIRTALMALIAFFTTEAKGAIGGLDAPKEERKRLAAISGNWKCPTCGEKNRDLVPEDIAPAVATKKGEEPSEGLEKSREAEERTEEDDRKQEIARSESDQVQIQRPVPIDEPISQPLLRPTPTIAALPPLPPIQPPRWIDRLIAICLVCIVALVAKRASRGSEEVMSVL